MDLWGWFPTVSAWLCIEELKCDNVTMPNIRKVTVLLEEKAYKAPRCPWLLLTRLVYSGVHVGAGWKSIRAISVITFHFWCTSSPDFPRSFCPTVLFPTCFGNRIPGYLGKGPNRLTTFCVGVLVVCGMCLRCVLWASTLITILPNGHRSCATHGEASSTYVFVQFRSIQGYLTSVVGLPLHGSPFESILPMVPEGLLVLYLVHLNIWRDMFVSWQ